MRALQPIYLYRKPLVAPGSPIRGPLAQQTNGLSIECLGRWWVGKRAGGGGVKFIDKVLLTKSRLQIAAKCIAEQQRM